MSESPGNNGMKVTPEADPATGPPGEDSFSLLHRVFGWEQQERIALLLLILVTVTVISGHLILGAIGKGPFVHPYSDASREGELVLLEGPVDRVTHTQEGGHLILQVRGVQVFVPSDAAAGHTITKGDAISLYGTVQTYRGDREIVVNTHDDIRLDDGSPL